MKVACLTVTLEYLILGINEDAQLAVLSSSEEMPVPDAAHFRQLAPLEPLNPDDGEPGSALALLPFDGQRAMLAYSYVTSETNYHPVYQYVLIPYEALDLPDPGLERIVAASPQTVDFADATANEWVLPASGAEQMRTREQLLSGAIGKLLVDDFELVMALLGAVMHERRLLVTNFPRGFDQRLDLILGIRALLPAAVAASMTFSTNALEGIESRPHLVFAEEGLAEAQWVFDWQQGQMIVEVAQQDYLDLLRNLWQGEIAEFAAELDKLDALATNGAKRGDLAQGLLQVAERYALDERVQTDADVQSSAMIEALVSAVPPQGELRHNYVKKLLENALHNRDRAAGKVVAEELEGDASLEASLAGVFDEMLETQPDTVYVFIRNRLHHLGIDESWISRLQVAARDSLEVAIEEGDVPTLISWLELIAREPLSYQLQEILRQGVMSSRERAHEDGELGIHLILIAVRRLPDFVDELYDDEALIAALTAKMGRALRDTSATTLEPLIDETAEYFLLALFHGIATSDEQLVTLASVAYLWSLFEADVKINLPVVYRPPAMIRALATGASHQLNDDALDLLLRNILNSDERELFVDAARHLAERDSLFPRLSTLLEGDNLTLDKVLSVLKAVAGLEMVSARDLVDAYFQLLDYYEWDPSTQPMMEALSRLMSKSHSLQLSYRHLWKQFENCNSLQIENATRVSINQILQQFNGEEDMSLVVAGMARICKEGNWSKALLSTLNAWWRDYTHSQSLLQLQRLEREMDTQRPLEAQKQILKTVLAMRRWVHNRDAFAFAEAVNSAFSLMEQITDAFDIVQLTEIDPATVRRELDTVATDLSADERHILANNLRSLAQRVTQMAEHRSKPSLIRSDDSIDRQLMRGEANPQGSVDMMKWVAGYLDGAHNDSDE